MTNSTPNYIPKKVLRNYSLKELICNIAYMTECGSFLRAELIHRLAEPNSRLQNYLQDYDQQQQEQEETVVMQEWPDISEDKKEVVRNIKYANDVNQSVKIILESGWDFTDPARMMIKTPAEVEALLESLISGRRLSYGDLHGSYKRLFDMIVDSWFRSAR